MVHPAQRPTCKQAARSRCGFTVLELLVSISVVGLLAGVLLPAIGASREAARRLQCVNHLKQIGIALHGHHDQFERLPAGWEFDPTRTSAYGWCARILPFLEQGEITAVVDRTTVIDDPVNAGARDLSLPIFLCPSDILLPSFELHAEHADVLGTAPLTRLPTANYIGLFGTLEADESVPAPPGEGTFIESVRHRFADLERGLSNTIVVGERTMGRVPSTWVGVDIRGEDAACRLVGTALTSPNCRYCDECEFDSRHPGGANFLWGDGHVSLVSSEIAAREYQTLSRRTEQ